MLDEGVYLGSELTFYRLLRQAGEVRECRRQATHLVKETGRIPPAEAEAEYYARLQAGEHTGHT